jgi:hypothetical protein
MQCAGWGPARETRDVKARHEMRGVIEKTTRTLEGGTCVIVSCLRHLIDLMVIQGSLLVAPDLCPTSKLRERLTLTRVARARERYHPDL